MSDSESSDLIDSEAGLEENEDELLLSSEEGEELMSASGEEDDSEMEEEESPEEVFMEDEEGEEEEEDEDSDNESAEEDRKLTEDELHRLYLDDFSSDDEVGNYSFVFVLLIFRKLEIPLATFPLSGMISMTISVTI